MSLTTTPRTIAYWVTTGLLAAGLIVGGVASLMRLPAWTTVMTHLGFPLDFLTIVGFWKMLGAFVLLAPRLPRLKEWTYAGVFFIMTGAVASHVAAGDSAAQFVWPALFALLAAASWALRPSSRVLGEPLPGRARERRLAASATLEPAR